jgi:hypothetical protein
MGGGVGKEIIHGVECFGRCGRASSVFAAVSDVSRLLSASRSSAPEGSPEPISEASGGEGEEVRADWLRFFECEIGRRLAGLAIRYDGPASRGSDVKVKRAFRSGWSKHGNARRAFATIEAAWRGCRI